MNHSGNLLRPALNIVAIIAIALLSSITAIAQTRHPDIVWENGGHQRWGINTAIATRSSDFIITGGHDGSIYIWDTTGRSIARTIEAHDDEVTGLALLNDSTLVSCSLDRTIRIWNMNSSEMLIEIRDSLDFFGVHVLEDSLRVVALTRSDIIVADTRNGSIIRRMAAGNISSRSDFALSGVHGLAFVADDTLSAWDVETGEHRFDVQPSHRFDIIAVARDGETLFTSHEVDSLRVHDALTGELLRVVTADSSVRQPSHNMAVSDDGSQLLIHSKNASTLYDLTSGSSRAFGRPSHETSGYVSIGILPGKHRFWITGDAQITYAISAPVLHIIDLATPNNPRSLIGFASASRRVVFRDSGSAIVVTDGDEVRMVSSSEAATLDVIPMGGFYDRRISIDGLAMSSSFYDSERSLSGSIYLSPLFDSSFGSILIADHLDGPSAGVPSPRGLFVWTSAKGFYSRELDSTLPVNSGRSVPSEFSYDASMVVGRPFDRGIDIFYSKPASAVRSIATGAYSRTAIFSRDGRLVATADADSVIRIIDVASSRIALTIDRADTGLTNISALVFSRNAEWLISGSENGAISVWNVMTGDLDHRYAHDKPITTIDIAPDNKHFVTGSEDGSFALWKSRGSIASSPIDIRGRTLPMQLDLSAVD